MVNINFDKRYLWGIIILISCVIFLFIAIKVVNSLQYVDSDFFSFWLAGRMNLNGQDPYLEDQWVKGHYQYGAKWISDRTFLYPLPLAVLFGSLGFFPLKIAYIMWIFFSQIMIISSIHIVTTIWKPAKILPFVFPILGGVLLFRPVIVTLSNGQLGALLLIVIASSIYLFEKERWISGGLLLPVLALKPQLGVPILVLLFIFFLAHRCYRVFLACIVSGIFFLLIGCILNPNWIVEFLNIGSTKVNQTFGTTPTLWGEVTFLCKTNITCSLTLGGFLCLAFIVLIISILVKRDSGLTPAWAFSLAIPTALFVTPYVWAYDQILLIIPILVVVIHMILNEYPYLLSALLFLIFTIISLGTLVLAFYSGTDAWSGALPFLVLCLVIYMLKIKVQLTKSVITTG